MTSGPSWPRFWGRIRVSELTMLTISDVGQLSRGASRRTWRFDATPAGQPRWLPSDRA